MFPRAVAGSIDVVVIAAAGGALSAPPSPRRRCSEHAGTLFSASLFSDSGVIDLAPSLSLPLLS